MESSELAIHHLLVQHQSPRSAINHVPHVNDRDRLSMWLCELTQISHDTHRWPFYLTQRWVFLRSRFGANKATKFNHDDDTCREHKKLSFGGDR
jgi:hypothetical protein